MKLRNTFLFGAVLLLMSVPAIAKSHLEVAGIDIPKCGGEVKMVSTQGYYGEPQLKLVFTKMHSCSDIRVLSNSDHQYPWGRTEDLVRTGKKTQEFTIPARILKRDGSNRITILLSSDSGKTAAKILLPPFNLPKKGGVQVDGRAKIIATGVTVRNGVVSVESDVSNERGNRRESGRLHR